MSNESAKKIHATVTGSAQPDEPTTTRMGPANAVGADDLTEADDIRDRHADDETDGGDVIDPDAVIIAETVTPDDDPAHPASEAARNDMTADIPPGRPDTAADTTPAVTDPGADISSAPAVTGTTPAAARAGATVDAEPAGTATSARGAVRDSTGTAGDATHLHERFTTIQSTFVDDPHGSVVAAAELVTEAIETLVSAARERERGLRSEWDRDGADTEDLRNALRNYRGFLDHLATL
jgi:hypothetical protein